MKGRLLCVAITFNYMYTEDAVAEGLFSTPTHYFQYCSSAHALKKHKNALDENIESDLDGREQKMKKKRRQALVFSGGGGTRAPSRRPH